MSGQPKYHSERTPVILGVGELADRPRDVADALDPVGLMVAALRLAQDDAGDTSLLARLDRLDIINEISWPYPDPEAELRGRLGQPDLATRYWPVGGQTPISALHEAAIGIQVGRAQIIAVCGGEAEHSVRRARREQAELPWPDKDMDFQPVRGGNFQNAAAQALGLTSPVNVYPLYENATRAAWRQDFDTAQSESARIWAHNSQIAAQREAAWLDGAVAPEAILSDEGGNRLIAWPYRKLMVANPIVNQGAAFIVTSLAVARRAGVPAERLVYFHGGAAADEPRDILARSDYRRSQAMDAVLGSVRSIADGRPATELYSCFPCVPKMARRVLDLPDDAELSVTGGLTFFGAPLNNFMGHAVVAMVQRLRAQRGWGMLYGQGEYVTKHHAVMLGAGRPVGELPEDYRLCDLESALESEAPRLDQDHRGAARLETFTVIFDRNECPTHGVVIARSEADARIAARVDAEDEETIAALTGRGGQVGRVGNIVDGTDGFPRWRFA